jgi:hypothetical protein
MKQAVSRSLLAVALMAQSKLSEAAQASRQAQAAIEKSRLRGDREFILIRDARVRAAIGHVALLIARKASRCRGVISAS